MEAEFLELMCDTITIAPSNGTFTDRGKANTGTVVSYPCHIEPIKGEEIIRSPTGQERKASWKIYVGTTSRLDPEGILTLPAGFEPQTPPFYAIERRSDQVGSHHQVIKV